MGRQLLLCSVLLCGCPTRGHNGGDPTAGPKALVDVLPAPPKGFDAPLDRVVRDRESIFEQINGASASYLDNGMEDALFATYVRSGAQDSLELNVFRFKTADGARAQWKELHGDDGVSWYRGSKAILDQFGVELVLGRVYVRSLYSDGPAESMRPAAEAIARIVVERMTGAGR